LAEGNLLVSWMRKGDPTRWLDDNKKDFFRYHLKAWPPTLGLATSSSLAVGRRNQFAGGARTAYFLGLQRYIACPLRVDVIGTMLGADRNGPHRILTGLVDARSGRGRFFPVRDIVTFTLPGDDQSLGVKTPINPRCRSKEGSSMPRWLCSDVSGRFRVDTTKHDFALSRLSAVDAAVGRSSDKKRWSSQRLKQCSHALQGF